MTLLQDVKSYLKDANLNYLDIYEVARETESAVEEEEIYLDRLRWGVLYGNVLARYDDGPQQVEYVMVTNYEFDEGADGGDPEVEAYSVEPHSTVKVVWDAI